MSKTNTSGQTKMTFEGAITNLAQRLKSLEGTSKTQFGGIERKLGDTESRFDALPDMDQIAMMFRSISERLDALTERMALLETSAGVKPPPKKRGGTVKLTDLDSQESTTGISFS